MTRHRLFLLLALALAACSKAPDPRQARLDAGMAFAHRTFARVGRDAITALALGSTIEQGGTLTTFLAAQAPDKLDLPPISDGAPSGPWSLAVREIDGPSVVIEAYGDSLDHPLRADTVSLRRQALPPGN